MTGALPRQYQYISPILCSIPVQSSSAPFWVQDTGRKAYMYKLINAPLHKKKSKLT